MEKQVSFTELQDAENFHDCDTAEQKFMPYHSAPMMKELKIDVETMEGMTKADLLSDNYKYTPRHSGPKSFFSSVNYNSAQLSSRVD